MAKVLNKYSPAIELVKQALLALKNKKAVIGYKMKEKRDSWNLEIKDLYFEVRFKNHKSTFELRIGSGDKTEIIPSKQHNKMRLNISGIIHPDKISEMISEKIPLMLKFEFSQSGIKEEERYSEILQMLKKKGIIEDFWHSGKEEDIEQGIDFFIKYYEKEVPSQAKSSRTGQKKHIVLFPKIPSIRLKNRPEYLIVQLTIKYLEAYINGKVIHV